MDGIPGSTLTGPFPVGQYAAALKDRLRGFARVQVFGEVFGFKAGRANVWFELRDASGAMPCSMWREDFDAQLRARADGAQFVVAGGCDYYPGCGPRRRPSRSLSRACGSRARATCSRSSTSSASWTARDCSSPRSAAAPAAAALHRRGDGESGKARDDLLAGLRRVAGRAVVWGFAPVQDRHAAPAIRARSRTSRRVEVEAIWSRAAAARWPICSRSATRRCAGRSRCCAYR